MVISGGDNEEKENGCIGWDEIDYVSWRAFEAKYIIVLLILLLRFLISLNLFYKLTFKQSNCMFGFLIFKLISNVNFLLNIYIYIYFFLITFNYMNLYL